MKGRQNRDRASVVGLKPKKEIANAVMAEAHQKGSPAMKACGGAVGGDKMKSMNLGRPGRKRGGRVGAELSPLSSAANTSARD